MDLIGRRQTFIGMDAVFTKNNKFPDPLMNDVKN